MKQKKTQKNEYSRGDHWSSICYIKCKRIRNEMLKNMKEKEIERLTKLKEIEEEIYNKNSQIKYICGIDEAGRGPLAGPVVVASVIMPRESIIEYINDSKKVTEKRREELYDIIKKEAIAYSVGTIDEKEIDEINILNATKKGLTNSLKELNIKPDLILVDALKEIDTLGIPYESIIKGDARCYSISAASILAKVTRDRIMREYDKKYPEYGFEKHKGYGTAFHISKIKEIGPCPIHRRTFIKNFIHPNGDRS